MSDFQEWLSENGIGLAIAALALGAFATQLPSIQEGFAQNQAVARQNRAQLQANQQNEAQKLALQAAVEIANDRFDKGCAVVEALAFQGVATSIIENGPIIEGAYASIYRKNPKLKVNPAHYIGRDITVCDLRGTTAVMKFDPEKGYATAQSIAVTNDLDRAKRAIDKKRLKYTDLKN
jgi:hypothetical protein